MKGSDLYERLLGLNGPWRVKDVKMDMEQMIVELHVECRESKGGQTQNRESKGGQKGVKRKIGGQKGAKRGSNAKYKDLNRSVSW